MKQLLYIFSIMFTLSPLSQAIIIIGHRGASGYEPENTLRSFKRAIDMGVPMIELDVYRSKSGEPVVIHDDTIDRTTNGTGSVKQLTWDELKTYNAGKSEHIPLLSQVFDLVNKRVVINIELKDPDAIKPVAQLINYYVRNKNWSYNSFIVSSFDHYVVRAFHNYCPLVKTGVIFEGNPIGYADIVKRAHAHYAIMYYGSVTKEFVDNAHACGIKVFVYTVNTKELVKKVQRLNVDGIITNYPDMLTLVENPKAPVGCS